MKSLIIGYGVQGKKRAKFLKKNNYLIYDKFNSKSDFSNFKEIPIKKISHAYICLPEKEKYKYIIKLLNSNYKGVVNVGSGKSHSVKELTKIISSVSGKSIKSKNIPVTGPYKLLTNINLLKKITKWKTKYTLKQGLIKTYKIMKKNT